MILSVAEKIMITYRIKAISIQTTGVKPAILVFRAAVIIPISKSKFPMIPVAQTKAPF